MAKHARRKERGKVWAEFVRLKKKKLFVSSASLPPLHIINLLHYDCQGVKNFFKRIHIRHHLGGHPPQCFKITLKISLTGVLDFWSLKMHQNGQFGEFLENLSLRSNSVT